MTGRHVSPVPGSPRGGGSGAQPVEVRLVGADSAVRQVVAALQGAADCGPASYRPARSGGTRAYVALVVPAAAAGKRSAAAADDVTREVYADQARTVLADFEAIDYTTVTPTDLAMMLGRFVQTTRFLLDVVDGGQR